jgi:hypothetical protein
MLTQYNDPENTSLGSSVTILSFTVLFVFLLLNIDKHILLLITVLDCYFCFLVFLLFPLFASIHDSFVYPLFLILCCICFAVII